MRLSFVFKILCVWLLCVSCLATLSSAMTFEEYYEKFDKQYGTVALKLKHEKAFYDNQERIEELRKVGYDSIDVGVFTDVPTHEFNHRRMSPVFVPLIEDDSADSDANPSQKRSDLPSEFDWRDKGAVTSVKDQGTVGTCYAFSTISNLEGQRFLKYNKLESLSAEQITDCDYLDCSVFGGWPLRAYRYIKEVGGIQSEDTFPYCAGSGKCYPCMPNKNYTFCGPPPEYCNRNCTADPSKFVVSVDSWRNITQNEDDMMQELIQTGPLSVLMNAELLQFHHSGVWDPPFCDPTSLDHALLLVGYGTHKGVFESKDYWLIKNSWGEKWGTDGYFMLRRGKGTCGINRSVSTASIV